MSDYTIYYGMTFLAIIITYGAQIYVQYVYRKYSQNRNEKGYTGSMVAKELLYNNGLQQVGVDTIKGYITDRYDPRNQTVSLSENNFNSPSLAALAIAAHECGHAMQDKDKYALLNIRASLVPIANFSSFAGYISIMMGLMLGMMNLIWIGIIMECVILAFQIITLPIEFDASKRGLAMLQSYGFVNDTELDGTRTVLTAAALTYVAGVASTLLQVLRLVLVYGRRGGSRRND